jgi:hypothetical protein
MRWWLISVGSAGRVCVKTREADDELQMNDGSSKFPRIWFACSPAPKTAMYGPPRKDSSIYWQQT